jgi:nucleoside-diphosphate-sugar epimerase
MKKNILITGGTGLVGSILTENLKEKFNIKVLDQKSSDFKNIHIGNIDKLDTIIDAFENIDTVVHLAGDRRVHGDWESVLQNNLVGIYNIYEAARIHKLNRVIFASSQHATGANYQIEPYSFIHNGDYDKLPKNYIPLDENTRIRPDSYYGVSKSFGEALGSYYSDYYNISTINLRIGWVISDDDPTFSPASLNLWLSHRDLTQIVEKSINIQKEISYETFYATSDNYWKIWSIDKAKKILDYLPEDSAPKDFELREIRDADK